MVGTPVGTPSGEVAIERLSLGGAVWCVDDAGQRVEGRVTGLMIHGERDETRYAVRMANGSAFEGTAGHMIYHPAGDMYLPLEDFVPGDYLRAFVNDVPLDVVIESMEVRLGAVTVYNIEVTPHNNYLVAGGIQVHNAKLEG